MGVSGKDREFMNEVVSYFKTTMDEESVPGGSIRKTALHFNLTRTKVQKILVTTGVYSTPQTREIQHLREEGMAVKEIARRMNVSQATVSASLPYTTVFHGTAEPNEHTQAVRAYRAYEKAQVKRANAKATDRTENANEKAIENKKNTMKEEARMKDVSTKKGEYILPAGLVRLHVGLLWVDTEEQEQALQQYGGVKRGRTITRDLIVPKNIPLLSLHYALQRALGFQDEHMHRYEIYAEDMRGVTDNKMEHLLNLRGVIFSQDESEDNLGYVYEGGSYRKWMRRIYTAPYMYHGDWLHKFYALEDGKEHDLITDVSPEDMYCLLTELHVDATKDEEEDEEYWEYYHTMVVPAVVIDRIEGEGECVKWNRTKSLYDRKLIRCSADDPDAMSIQRMKLGELNIMQGLRGINEHPTRLIERLKIGDVLAMASDYLPYDDKGKKKHTVVGLKHPQIVTKEQIQEALQKGKQIAPKPFADMLMYIYDFGDNWHFAITGSHGCSDLVEDGVITKAELEKSIKKAQLERHPVLLARDGDMLFEDSGNVIGFVRFLKHVNLDPDDVIEQVQIGEDPDEEDEEWNNLDEEDLEEDDEELWVDDVDDEELDENGMTRGDLLDWAVGQGWHKNDISNINLL
ncbi:MAG: helix-turn-helix domain-containing protein [Clostridia bacterium]|nr:helix-turn-helix domain-containing protein [Clostridia bacterium]